VKLTLTLWAGTRSNQQLSQLTSHPSHKFDHAFSCQLCSQHSSRLCIQLPTQLTVRAQLCNKHRRQLISWKKSDFGSGLHTPTMGATSTTDYAARRAASCAASCAANEQSVCRREKKTRQSLSHFAYVFAFGPCPAGRAQLWSRLCTHKKAVQPAPQLASQRVQKPVLTSS
jgi:hypothetical protein